MKLKKINKFFKYLGLRMVIIAKESIENPNKRPETDILIVRLKTFLEMVKTLRANNR